MGGSVGPGKVETAGVEGVVSEFQVKGLYQTICYTVSFLLNEADLLNISTLSCTDSGQNVGSENSNCKDD
jgi:hypothetical protein